MSFPLKCTVLPAAEPVTVAEMHAQLRLDPGFMDDDALIADMISAARMEIEDITGRALLPQTWLLATDWFPVYRWWDYAPSRSDYDSLGNYNFMGYRWNHSQTIAIPRPPLIKIDSLTYVSAADGSTQSIDPTTIQVDAISEPGRIMPAYGGYWPQAQPQANAVQLTFTAGYTTQAVGAPFDSGQTGGVNKPTVQVGDPTTFYSLDKLARADGATMGAWSVSASGLLTLAAADQNTALLATYTSTAVPAWARQALRLIATAWYENRSEYMGGQQGGTPIPRGANDILMKHRTELFGYVGRG